MTYISYAVWGSCGGVDELEKPFCGVAAMDDASGGGSKRLEDAEERKGTGGVEDSEDSEDSEEEEEEEEDEEEDGGDKAEETEAEVGVGNEVVGLLKLVFC